MDSTSRHRERMQRGRQIREERAAQRARMAASVEFFEDGVGAFGDDLSAFRSQRSTDAFRIRASGIPWARQHVHALQTPEYDNYDDMLDRSYDSRAVMPWASSPAALSRTLPAGWAAALDPSKHACETADAFRFGERSNSSSPTKPPRQSSQQQILLWTGQRPPDHNFRSSAQNPEDFMWESWEAKWAKILEVEEEAMRANAEKAQRFAKRQQEREAAARAERERRECAQQKSQEQWQRTQQEGFRQFEQQRERWRQDDAQWRGKHAEPQWWEKSSSQSSKPSRQPPPSRPQQPSSKPSAAPPPPVPKRSERQFASWAEYSATWDAFDRSKGKIRYEDIPWPNTPGGALGASASCSQADKKKKLFAALRRWHPDKWQSMLDRVIPGDLDDVRRRIKEVTEEILAEKQRAGL